MKNKTILIGLLFCFVFEFVALSQQNETIEIKQPKKLYFGIGYGFGFFHPDDVNDYIYYKTLSYYTYEGTTDMWLNFSGNISLTYKLNKRIEFTGFAEYAWAPKFVLTSETESEYFSFTRFTPGVKAKFHMPIGSGRHSIYIGPGITYNFMKFEIFSASSSGAKIESGISLNFGKFNMQPFLCIDFASATDKTNDLNSEFVLNYSGVELGINFMFKL